MPQADALSERCMLSCRAQELGLSDDSHETVVQGARSVAAASTMALLEQIAPPGIAAALGAIRAAVSKFCPTGTQEFQAAVEEEIRSAVFTRLPEVEANLRGLLAREQPVTAQDFVHAVSEFSRSYQQSIDERKRAMLKEAFVNTFNPDLHEAGLVELLWAKLDRLSYGALQCLRDIVAQGPPERISQIHREGVFHDPIVTFGRVMQLVRWGPSRQALDAIQKRHGEVTPTSLSEFHISTLVAEKLVVTSVSSSSLVQRLFFDHEPTQLNVEPTELGLKMALLISKSPSPAPQ